MLAPAPDRFSIEHDFETSTSLLSPASTLPALLLLVAWCAIGIWLMRSKSRRNLAFFILWVPATLLIESSFIALEMVFEHRMYLPSVGLFGAAAWLLHCQLHGSKLRQALLGMTTLGVVIVLAVLTAARVPLFRTERSLMEQATQVAPNSGRAWAGLGLTLLRDGETNRAREVFERALKLDPGDDVAPEFLGVLRMDQGRLDEAEDLLSLAASNGNNSASLKNHLGELHLARHEYAAAADGFAAATRELPWVPAYHFNLALALELQGQCTTAYDSWQQYLQLEADAEERQTVEEHLIENYRSPRGRCAIEVD
jgi:Flp pilus assembly protein TadD